MINQKSNLFQNLAMQFVTALIIFSWLSYLSVVFFSENNTTELTKEELIEKKPWLKYPNGGKLTVEEMKGQRGAIKRQTETVTGQDSVQDSKVGE